jgi:hypothetical protein
LGGLILSPSGSLSLLSTSMHIISSCSVTAMSSTATGGSLVNANIVMITSAVSQREGAPSSQMA